MDEAYQSVVDVKGECGRKYRTVECVRGPCEPMDKIACCKANIPGEEEYAEFRELMLKQCDGKKLSECDRKKLRQLRLEFGTMVWGFNPTGWSYAAGRVLNRSQLKDNSVFFGKEVIGSFFFFMVFVWSVAGFSSLMSPGSVSVSDGPNSGLNSALNTLVSYQFARDLLSTHYWAYVGAIFSSVFLSHLLWVTAHVEGLVAAMLWFFSDDGMLTARKPRFSVLLSTLLGQAAGFAIAGAITLAVWEHKDAAFATLQFQSLGYSDAHAWLFENTGGFIIAMGWIASLVVPRTLIKQFHSFQVVVPVMVTLFHAVAKALTLYTTGGALGLWTYVMISLFLTGFGGSIWVFLVAPITSAIMAGLVWFVTTRYIYSFGGNKREGLVFRLNF